MREELFPPSFLQSITRKATRLGEDVLAVLNSLKLSRPVLVGHSIAGEELSFIGSRYPQRISGLIYLDAGYPYALYVHSPNSILLDWDDMRNKVEALTYAPTPQQQESMIRQMLQVDLPQSEQELEEMQEFLIKEPDQPEPSESTMNNRSYRVARAVHDGEERFTQITCPLLAIFAEPAQLSCQRKRIRKPARGRSNGTKLTRNTVTSRNKLSKR